MDEEKSKKLVETIIKGSTKIDQLRRAIDIIVRTFIGFGFDLEETRTVLPITLRTYWEISKSGRSRSTIRFMIKCDDSLADQPAYSSTTGGRGIKLENVEMVYDALPDLVSYVMSIESFPKDKLQPLIWAASFDS